jgi:hypothetical protein
MTRFLSCVQTSTHQLCSDQALHIAVLPRLAALPILLCMSYAAAQCPPAAWVPGIGAPGFDGDVYAVTVLQDGDVIAAGSYRSAGGNPASCIARYHPASGIWSPMGMGTDIGSVWALAVAPNGDLIAGGGFSEVGSVTVNNIGRYRPSTGIWSPLGAGMPGGGVQCVAVLPDGDVLVGGRFTTAGRIAANSIARFHSATNTWSPLGTGVSGPSHTTVNAIAVLADGTAIAAGTFDTAGGIAANNIARYNPSTGEWSSLGAGTDDEILSLAILDDGDVLAGGLFTTAGETPAHQLARFDAATTTWSEFGGITEDTILPWSMQVIADGDVVLGGYFTALAGTPAHNLARFDLTTGTWSAMGAGTGGDAYSLALLPQGDLIVGGFFRDAGGTDAGYIAQYSFGGVAPSVIMQPQSIHPCASEAVTLSVNAQGSTATLDYQWQKDAAPIDIALNPSAATTALVLDRITLADVGVYDCIIRDACGSVKSDEAVLDMCLGDFNCDGGVDGSDVGAFFDVWEAGIAAADVNADGGIDAVDVGIFFERWEQGC